MGWNDPEETPGRLGGVLKRNPAHGSFFEMGSNNPTSPSAYTARMVTSLASVA
jgi:hypothetical protein